MNRKRQERKWDVSIPSQPNLHTSVFYLWISFYIIVSVGYGYGRIKHTFEQSSLIDEKKIQKNIDRTWYIHYRYTNTKGCCSMRSSLWGVCGSSSLSIPPTVKNSTLLSTLRSKIYTIRRGASIGHTTVRPMDIGTFLTHNLVFLRHGRAWRVIIPTLLSVKWSSLVSILPELFQHH